MRYILGFIGVIVVLALAGACISYMTPNSSSDVRVVDDNVVHLPEGDTAAFSQFIGKTYYTWQVSYEDSIIHSDCQPMCTDADVRVGDVGKPVKVNTNGPFTGQFTVTKQFDGSVHLAWPYGMAFHD